MGVRLLVGLLSASQLFGCVGAVHSGHTSVEPKVVPNVVTWHADAAEAAIYSAGLVPEIELLEVEALARQYGSDTRSWPTPNTIVYQDPPPGIVLEQIVPVRMQVASWSNDLVNSYLGPVTLDFVANPGRLSEFVDTWSLVLIRELIDEEQLEDRFGEDRNHWPPPSTIIGQQPAAGGRAVDGSLRIDVVGQYVVDPPVRDVPNVVGLSEAAGMSSLESLGFVPVVKRLGGQSLSRRYGLKLENWPKNGEIVDQQFVASTSGTDQVQIDVATWSRSELLPNTIPDVRNLPAGDAISQVDDAGYAVVVRDVTAGAMPGAVVSQSVEFDPMSGRANVVLSVERKPEVTSSSRDDDGDGVPNDRDSCPNTDVGASVDLRGCSAGQLYRKLEYGLYTFIPEEREMLAERKPAYEVSITLQTAKHRSPDLSDEPTVEEFLNATGEVPGDADIEDYIADVTADSGRPPLSERWAPVMTLTLKPEDPQTATVTRAAENIVERTVLRGKTTWTWLVTPHCVAPAMSPTKCRDLKLVADAVAHIGADGKIPYTLFRDEIITIEITNDVLVTSFWSEYKEIIITAILIPFVIWVFRHFRRGDSSSGKPVAPPEKHTILVLGANPMNTARLNLAGEVKSIDSAIRAAEYRDSFQLEHHGAVASNDIDELFTRYAPSIVHFSAHGSEIGELILNRPDDSDGVATPVSSLENLFELVGSNVRLVVLNACYSENQAEALSRHVDAVIGMSRAIKDSTATAFAKSFYSALANGRDLQTAFKLGCQEAGLTAVAAAYSPKLIAGPAARTMRFADATSPDAAVLTPSA